MHSYGQHCPVAKAMELLDERWTMLVVRELVAGSRHFNELRRGVPRMSPALLSKRLRTLVRHGVVDRFEDGNRVVYQLTPAGEELAPIVESIGRWGVRWIGELGDEDLDPHLLVWDIHRNIDLEAVPGGRTVLKFTFRDVAGPARSWWLVIAEDSVDVCDVEPGHPLSATVETELRAFTLVWRGDRTWDEALRSGELVVHAPQPVRRALPRWLTLSSLASVPRPD
jgi:DNA-binding HxlR family transcriptional regulator